MRASKPRLRYFLSQVFRVETRDFSQAIAGEVVLAPGLLPEVLVLGSCRLGEHGGDESGSV